MMVTYLAFLLMAHVAHGDLTEHAAERSAAADKVVCDDEDIVMLQARAMVAVNGGRGHHGPIRMMRNGSQFGASTFYGYEEKDFGGVSGGASSLSGCCEGSFWAHEYTRTVKELKVWGGDMRRRRNARRRAMINGMSFKFHGDSREYKYGTTGGPPTGRIVFNPGDTLRSMSIQLNENNILIPGKIEIESSSGAKLSVGGNGGGLGNKYDFPVQGRFFSGFAGATKVNDGTNNGIGGVGNYEVITALKPLIWYPISRGVLKDIRYTPDLSQLAPLTQPMWTETNSFCNVLSVPAQSGQVTITKAKTTGSTACFETTWQFGVGMTVTASGGIPGVIEISTQYRWDASYSQTRQKCEEAREANTREVTMPSQSVPANSEVQWTYSQYGGQPDVRYDANMEIHFMNNLSPPVKMQVNGWYEGIGSTKIISSIELLASPGSIQSQADCGKGPRPQPTPAPSPTEGPSVGVGDGAFCQGKEGLHSAPKGPENEDCRGYYNCFRGNEQMQVCPAGTRFSPDRLQCDWARNVSC